MRLDGKVQTGSERAYCDILAADEELSVVNYAKNMNRAHQGLNKEKIAKLILDILRLRDHLNKRNKGGRKFKKLSPNAKAALEKNRYKLP